LDPENFLYDLCKRTLEIDNSVKFVGVVNVNGKLIVGKGKQLIDNQNEIIDKNFFKFCLNPSYNKFYYGTTDSAPSIDNNKNTLSHSKLIDSSDFHLICIRENTFIAFTSLTEESDKYLCIYFKVNVSVNDVLPILNMIFDYNE